MNRENLKQTILNIKKKIQEYEDQNIQLTEADTRVSLIDPLLRSLGWDFSNLLSVRTEYQTEGYNEAADYALFTPNTQNPSMILEAKRLNSNLNDHKFIKQLCSYLGQIGIKWGVLSDGNKYIMYNANSNFLKFEDSRFLTLQVKTIDTEDGISLDELVDYFESLLSQKSLSDNRIQEAYENHVVNEQIKDALSSLMSEPFDTLAKAIQNEFKEERVKTRQKISRLKIIDFLKTISDEDGKLGLDFESQDQISQEHLMKNVSEAKENKISLTSNTPNSLNQRVRISILDLLEKEFVHEGDNWKFNHKGEMFWGRITGNGELEVNGKTFKTPSNAANYISQSSYSGWNCWNYKDAKGLWHKVDVLRQKYRDEFGVPRLYSEEDHLNSVEEKFTSIYNQIKLQVLELNPALQFAATKKYISIRGDKNLAFLQFQQKGIRLILFKSADYLKSINLGYEIIEPTKKAQVFWNGECSYITIDHDKYLNNIINELKPFLMIKLKEAS